MADKEKTPGRLKQEALEEIASNEFTDISSTLSAMEVAGGCIVLVDGKPVFVPGAKIKSGKLG